MARDHKIRQLELALAEWLSHPRGDSNHLVISLFDFHSVYFYAKEFSTIQSNTVSVLKRGIPQLLAKIWHHSLAPPELLISVQNMIYLIIDGLLVNELVNTHRTGEDKPSNFQIVQFYNELYSQAYLAGSRSPLLKKEHALISHQFLELLEGNIDLCQEMFEMRLTPVPYEFFIHHIEIFYLNVARCYQIAHSNSPISKMVSILNHLVLKKLVWSNQDETSEDRRWKVLFIERLFATDFEKMDFEVYLLSSYLLLFEQWIPLLQVSQQFIFSLNHEKAKVAILNAVKLRMVLIARSPNSTDAECLMILNFINGIFETNSCVLITELLYSFDPYNHRNVDALIERFEKAVCRVMGASKFFQESITLMEGRYQLFTEECKEKEIEFSCQRLFSRFLCDRFLTYFSNSLLINKQILYFVQELVKFDLLRSEGYPIDIVLTATRLLEAIKLPVYMTLASPKFQNIEFLPEDSITCDFRREGAIQNIRLFENIMSSLYATIRLKKDRRNLKNT